MTRFARLILLPAACLLAVPAGAVADDLAVTVFDRAEIRWDEDREPDAVDPDGYVIRHAGQSVTRTLELPDAPADQRDARRIIATIAVEPVYSETDGRKVPNDRWTRLGNITVLAPPAVPGEPPEEVELLRFVTPYGGPASFEQDLTAFAPLLHGRRTLRGFVSSYSTEPGWTISLLLTYTSDGVGQRRPAFARGLFTDLHLTAEESTLHATVRLPEGLDLPRLRVISTGHATDGLGAHEFTSAPHVLRIDGRVVARWRPWSEEGGTLRRRNPWAGRRLIDGREVRSSDFDRSGWHPGLVVAPLVIPLPELQPGEHRIDLQVVNIRPEGPPTEDDTRHHGYWAVSAAIVADEPWPPLPPAQP